MTDLSLEEFSALTARFYEAAVDDMLWSETIGALKTCLNLSKVGLGWFDTAGSSQMLHGDCDSHFNDLFSRLGRQNIFLPRMQSQQVGTAFTDEALVPKSDFRRTVMFNEWFVPQDEHSAMSLKVFASPGSQGFLIVQRGGRQPAFSRADEDVVRLLAPSLIHALHIRRRMALLRLQRQGEACDTISMGFAVANASGAILQSNATADRQFGEGQGLTVRRGRVAAVQSSGLGAAIARAAALPGLAPAGSEVVIRTGDDQHPAYALSISPISPGGAAGLPGERGAMIFIQPLNRDVPGSLGRRVQALFGLTQREAALAEALASGKSLKQAAEGRPISMATARTQLAQIFRKTNTTRQGQLVSLLLGILPVCEA